MKNRILFYTLITLFAIACSSDPCEDPINIECETGDADGDGVLNSSDTAPLDPCSPDMDSVNCPSGDFDKDGVINSEDSSPEDPCAPNPDSILCSDGDFDNDGVINSEDSDPEDPCLPKDNISCPTGDLDGDGIINSEDANPLDNCIPNTPSFSVNIIGRWTWSTFGANGIVEIIEDGTFVEISGVLVSNGNVVERTWTIENVKTLVLEVKKADGLTAKLNLKSKSYDCEEVTFEGFFDDVIFKRQ